MNCPPPPPFVYRRRSALLQSCYSALPFQSLPLPGPPLRLQTVCVADAEFLIVAPEVWRQEWQRLCDEQQWAPNFPACPRPQAHESAVGYAQRILPLCQALLPALLQRDHHPSPVQTAWLACTGDWLKAVWCIVAARGQLLRPRVAKEVLGVDLTVAQMRQRLDVYWLGVVAPGVHVRVHVQVFVQVHVPGLCLVAG